MVLGTAHIYLNPNRNGSGERWLWSYFEPASGLDKRRVSMLWGNLCLDLDDYQIVEKSTDTGYDIAEKIQERVDHGYSLMDPLPAEDLAVVMNLIKAWQPVLFHSRPVTVAKELLASAQQGITMLGGNPRLATRLATLTPLVLTHITSDTGHSRYDW